MHLTSTIQLPVAQMGCVAGAAAVNRAFDHCQQSPNNNALIVTLETSSLCFDKYANRIQDFVTNSLFGDACAAVVMRGDDQTSGMKLTHSASHFLQQSEAFIRYDMTPRGFKFSLDKEVMYSIEPLLLSSMILFSLVRISDLKIWISTSSIPEVGEFKMK